MILFLILAVVFGASVILIEEGLRKAPEGIEDEHGFHVIGENSHDEHGSHEHADQAAAHASLLGAVHSK